MAKIKSNIHLYFNYQSYPNKIMRNHDLIYSYFEPNHIIELKTSQTVYVGVDFKKYRYTSFDNLHADNYQNY